jgi:ketosteroid isomerase-like protein
MVRVDLGVDHGAPVERVPDWMPPASAAPSSRVLDAAARDAAQRALESVDARSGRAAVAAGNPALLEALAEDVRWQRSGRLPVVGRARVIEATAVSGEALEWAPEVTAVAASGDFGYAYGRGRSTVDGQDSREFAYLNIWQRRDGAWRLVVHTARRVQAPAN